MTSAPCGVRNRIVASPSTHALSGPEADTDARPIRSISNLPSRPVDWIADRMPVVTMTLPAAGSCAICQRGVASMSSGVRLTFGSGIGRSGVSVSDAGTIGRRTFDCVFAPVARRIRGLVRVGQILGKSLHEMEMRMRWPAGTT